MKLTPTHYRTGTGKLVFSLQVTLVAIVVLIIVASSAVSVKKAIVSVGSVRLTPSIATIQHPSGGMLDQMFMRDGQVVKEGQPLFKLDTSRQQAQLAAIDKNLAASKASLHRMKLQIDNAEAFKLGDLQLPNTLNISDQYAVIETERQIFNSWQEARADREDVFLSQIAGIQQRMDDAIAQLNVIKKQKKILQEQIDKRLPAVRKGIIAKTAVESLQQRLLEQDSRYLQIKSAINSDQAEIDSLSKNINAQNAQEISQFSEAARDEVQRFENFASQRLELENDIRLSTPRAPIDGIVMGLVEKERKTAISGGEVLARIVPEDATPYIRVKVAASEVDNITKLKSVRVTFGFDEPVKMQHLKARVSRIDPDVQTDPETGQQNYLVDIGFDPDLVRQDIIPGMPVEVGFVFDQGSLIWSLFQPFADAYRKTFDVNEVEK